MNDPAVEEPWTRAVADPDAWLEAERAAIAEATREAEPLVREALLERERAVTELERMRRRVAVRAATAVDRRLVRGRRMAGAVRRRATPGARATGPGQEATPSHSTPAAFRAAFLDTLEARRLRVAVVRPAEVADAPAPADTTWPEAWSRALVAAGWTIVDDPAESDVAIVAGPPPAAGDLPRGPVLVADDPRAAAAVDVTLGEPPEGPDADVVDLVARLPDALREWATATRIGIAIGAPSWEVAPTWGDLHFARGLQRQLAARGHPTRIHVLPDWTDAASARDDVAIHLFGLRERRPHRGQQTILWVISHPDKVTDRMLDEADRVYVASDLAVPGLQARTATPVSALHQATDPDVFRVDRSGPRHAVLFVGNTRGVRREIVDWITPTSLDLAIYGQGWKDRLPDSRAVRGEHIPNERLHRWYGAAGVVLNDHWPDMREGGFLSNRLYDVLAAGGFVISDAVAGIDEEFDGGVVTVASGGELRWAVRDHLADPARRRDIADRGRRAVLERHTFAHRADTILADLAEAVPGAAVAGA
jgi:hypothetical protein